MTRQYTIVSTDIFGTEIEAPQIFKSIEAAMEIAKVMIETGMDRATRSVIEFVQIATIKKTGRYTYEASEFVTEKMETQPRI